MIEIYFDTEFTSLESLDVKLISIGCTTVCGKTFYAEAADYSLEDCSGFTKEIVLPLLDGNKLEDHEITLKLGNWIEDLGEPCIFVSDAPQYDYPFIQELFSIPGTWPGNLEDNWKHTTFNSYEKLKRFLSLKQNMFANGYRHHHALDDAIVMMKCYREANDVS